MIVSSKAHSNIRRVLALTLALAPAALLACNSIIGTEDRFYATDASVGSGSDGSGASTRDATTSNGQDGAMSGDDDDATIDAAEAADARTGIDGSDGGTPITDGNTADGAGACRDSGTCPLPPPVVTLPSTPAITGFDVDTSYVYLAAGLTGVYAAPIAPDAGVDAGASVYFLDSDGTHKILDVGVLNATLYMLEYNSSLDEPYVSSCAAAPGGCTTRASVSTAPDAIDFAVTSPYIYYWGSGEIYRRGTSTSSAGVPTPVSVAVGTTFLFTGSPSGINRLSNGASGFGGTNVENTQSQPQWLAVDSLNVYGADTAHGKIVQYAQTFSESDAPATIASNLSSPKSLRIDGGNLYWITTGSASENALMTCPAPDCNEAAPTVLQVLNEPVEMLLRSDAFYVQDVDSKGKTVIYRLPR